MLTKRRLTFGILLTLFLSTAIVLANTPVRTPQGFDKVVVFIAAGQFDASTPSPVGDTAMWFHKEVMGRSDAEIEQEKQDAKAYFDMQFGVIVEPMAFGVDPRNEYRAYIISGMDIPEEGWVVRDGGFMYMFMIDTTLYGVWGGVGGTMVPSGSMLVYGDYSIDMTGPGKSGKNPPKVEPIIIRYRSGEPITPDPLREGITFRCTTIAPWGAGIAQGTTQDQSIDGITIANWRNVHTYPSYGPSIVHDSP